MQDKKLMKRRWIMWRVIRLVLVMVDLDLVQVTMEAVDAQVGETSPHSKGRTCGGLMAAEPGGSVSHSLSRTC